MNRILRAGIVLGLGIGGFFDGIVLHQILGWHHMVCKTPHCRPLSIAQLEQQNTLDGFFHLTCWILCVIGLVLLSGTIRNQGTRVVRKSPCRCNLNWVRPVQFRGGHY